jgi:hypothetical protein
MDKAQQNTPSAAETENQQVAAKARETEVQALVLDSAAKSQLDEARALMLEGKKEYIGLAQSIFRQSLKNQKLADSTHAAANQLKQEAQKNSAASSGGQIAGKFPNKSIFRCG